jgi:toluene monooxygenase system ferredoxin subunit
VTFHRVCGVDELPDGQLAAFFVDDVEVLLVPGDGAPRAFDGICPHEGHALVDGTYDGETIVCSGHRWRFNATTGRGINPSSCRLVRFPLEIDDGAVYVDVDTEMPPE